MAHHMKVLAESLRATRAAERQSKRQPKENTDFLPGALEVMERPPNPLGRLMLWTIIMFMGLALAWSIVGRLDVVAVAEGRIIPDGRVKTVQAADQGVVRAIRVRDGQRVEAGELLVELDSTVSKAEVEQAHQALRVAEIDRNRAQALLDFANGKPHAFKLPDGVREDVRQTQLSIIEARIAEFRSTREAFVQELNQRRQDQAMVKADVARIEQQLPLAEKQLSSLQALEEKGFTSKMRLNEVNERTIGVRQDLIIRREELTRAQAAQAGAAQKLEGAATTFRREALDAFNEADATARLRQEALTIALRRDNSLMITAPVSGVVQQSQVHTIGAVVKPADALLVIVPEQSGLVVEANVLNRDVGFVREGQDVRVKLEAFPFTRYGIVDGKLAFLSRDAINDEKRGLIFPARIELARSSIHVAPDRTTPLSAGMAVTAEVRTGQRRIIEFLLSPLARRMQGARNRMDRTRLLSTQLEALSVDTRRCVG